MDKIEFIARIRHLGWICFQIAAGQSYNIKINDDQFRSLLNGVQYALRNPNASAEENHENWMKMKISQGWVYGEKKDFNKKTHPDLVPFNDLPEIEKKKDIMDNLMNKLAINLWDDLEYK
ncbi:hypothetical protein LCGC14_0755510 [marine sediment metagenome]|uniref:Ryanodine receptor Ryr domain-containing protein n=1 Tax=marine sediment metagenome TaxID=412755 RepID=A0A0F9T9S1_9ZZZZ